MQIAKDYEKWEHMILTDLLLSIVELNSKKMN